MPPRSVCASEGNDPAGAAATAATPLLHQQAAAATAAAQQQDEQRVHYHDSGSVVQEEGSTIKRRRQPARDNGDQGTKQGDCLAPGRPLAPRRILPPGAGGKPFRWL